MSFPLRHDVSMMIFEQDLFAMKHRVVIVEYLRRSYKYHGSKGISQTLPVGELQYYGFNYSNTEHKATYNGLM